VASLLGSRGTAIGILLGWQLAMAPVLVQIRGLGSLRAGMDAAALRRIEPDAIATAAAAVPVSGLAAVAVLVVGPAWHWARARGEQRRATPERRRLAGRAG
jgi:hypothetical protein